MKEIIERRRTAQLDWLDALKGMAILAVVIDHAFIVDSFIVWKHVYFAVSFFIFLSGVSNTISARRRNFRPLRDAPEFWGRRLRTLLGPYLWASVLGYVIVNHRSLSLLAFLKQLALFHSLPPLYFIALLLQFLLVFPLLYWLLFRLGNLLRVLTLVPVVLVGTLISQVVTFPWVLGAHYLLGASFLYLFVAGMLAAPILVRTQHPRLVALGSLIVFAYAERVVMQSDAAVMTHPPSNLLVVYSIALLGIFYGAFRVSPGAWLTRGLSYLGHHSLDIFLYHYVFLLPILDPSHQRWSDRLSLVHAQLLLMLIDVPVAIAGSLAVAWLSKCLWRVIVWTWQKLWRLMGYDVVGDVAPVSLLRPRVHPR